MAQWKRMWGLCDNQDVGLEAATIERVRNSSLVERPCAENVTGLSHAPKLRMRAFLARVVGEHSLCGEAGPRGRVERKEASMPQSVTIKWVKNPFAVRPRVPGQW